MRAGDEVDLTSREAEVAFLLALTSRATGGQIAGNIWPDSDAPAAATLAKVYVHKLRRRMGFDFIVRHKAGYYSLSPLTSVDVPNLSEDAFPRPSRDELEHPRRRVVLVERARRLRLGRPPNMLGWEWFGPIQERLVKAGRDLALVVARFLNETGKPGESLTLLESLANEDPCDEEVREVKIRALIADGQQASAFEEYRRYEATLRRELHVAPATDLRMLFSQF
jgi:DNA-binding SARP family transcriptional activator